MNCRVTIQYGDGVVRERLPDPKSLRQWVRTAARFLQDAKTLEVTLRIVDEAESQQLNEAYRQKPGPTNVLSFSYGDDAPAGSIIGDLVICAPVVAREALDQGKPEHGHWAHMVVHGIMHLAGYDHETPSEADVMECAEIRILGSLGIHNPY